MNFSMYIFIFFTVCVTYELQTNVQLFYFASRYEDGTWKVSPPGRERRFDTKVVSS